MMAAKNICHFSLVVLGVVRANLHRRAANGTDIAYQTKQIRKARKSSKEKR
jgi:hypothetical protein